MVEDRGLWVVDIETIKSVFTYTGYNIDTKEVVQYVIHKDLNQLRELYKHINECKGHITFNGLNFDYPILHFILTNYYSWLEFELSTTDIIDLIYQKAQWIIDSQKEEINKKKVYVSIKEKDVLIPQLDIFSIFHFSNKAKITSLKWIQFSIDYPNIEEMPIHHSLDNITLEQVEDVKSYNLNDVMSTYELYRITIGDTEHPLYKGIDKVQLRKDIIAEFGINCINYNDVKIGDELNKIIYSKFKGITKYNLPKKGTFRDSIKVNDCIQPIEFNDLSLKYFYDTFTKKVFNPIKLKEEKGEKIKYKNLIISFGFGGLHTVDLPRKINIDSEYYLSDKDCTGMYPRTIIERQLYPKHLGIEWCKGCEYIYNKRANEYKPLSKKDKKAQSFSEAFKLANNGGSFGMTNQINNWQYDSLVTFSVTLFNQFALLKLTEMLMEKNIQVVSLNTDGCLSLVRYDKKEEYEEICYIWEKQFKHTLEETLYKSFIQTSVNDYIAITLDNKIKKKGDFSTEFELHKNKSALIVPLALEAYYTKNIPILTTIKEDNNIFNFCLGTKSIGQNRLYEMNTKNSTENKLQKINRYYISLDGNNIIKRLPPIEGKKVIKQLDIFGVVDDGTREQEIEAGYLSTIFNKYVKKDIKDYNINYQYYIDRCNKIIQKIN